MDVHELWKSFWRLLFYRENLHLLDLEVLKAIEKTKQKLNFAKIKRSPIDFFVAVFDYKNLAIKYINGKKDTLDVIHLSSYLPPYIYLDTKTKDTYDGKTVPNACFLDVVKKNPDKRIIWIMNERRNKKNILRNLPYHILDFYAKSLYFGFRYMIYHLFHFFDETKIEKIHTYPNVILIYPDDNVRKITKDKKRIVKLFYNGISRGKRILKRLNIK